MEDDSPLSHLSHLSHLSQALQALLREQRVATLGTLNADGTPMVSMAPYAIEPSRACIVIHVSGLAAHTPNLMRNAAVSLMIMRAEEAGAPVHALPRATLEGSAEVLAADTPEWTGCRTAYLARFPEAEPMTGLTDFMFVAIHPRSARHIAGFGSARSLGAQELAQLLATVEGPAATT